MGGAAFVGGNASPAAEANILNDPEAADIVFGAECPIVMAGLDVTESKVMSPADLGRIATFANQRARHLAAILPFYVNFYAERNRVDGIYVHDSTAISYLLAPHRFEWEERPIRVDTGHSVCRGRTQPAKGVSDVEGPWAGRRSVRILTRSDMPALVELELERLAGG
jgi:inosine-uridine nucleoside N-ribohydrolase